MEKRNEILPQAWDHRGGSFWDHRTFHATPNLFPPKSIVDRKYRHIQSDT
jgi:hypothetical protein